MTYIIQSVFSGAGMAVLFFLIGQNREAIFIQVEAWGYVETEDLALEIPPRRLKRALDTCSSNGSGKINLEWSAYLPDSNSTEFYSDRHTNPGHEDSH